MVKKITQETANPVPTETASISIAKPNENESLEDLAALAGNVDNPITAADNPTPPASPPKATNDILDVLTLARDMAAPMVENMGYLKPGQTEEIWSKERLKAIAEPLAAIMERHGVGMAEAMSQYAPYIALIVGLWAPAMSTWQAIQSNAIALTADAPTATQ